MANTTNLNVRVDEDLKHQAESLFSELGMNLSTAMNLFLRSAIRYGGIPFELRVSSKPSDFTGMSQSMINAKLHEGLSSMKSGKGRPARDFFDELESEFKFGRV